MIPLITFSGYANSGKTTIVEKIIAALQKRGLSVATIKHAGHGYEIGPKGKDSSRYFQAGAVKVVLAGPESLTIHEKIKKTPTLKEICARIQDVDLILAEGFKKEPVPKIEVFRQDISPERLSSADVIAVVSDVPLEEEIPCFNFEEIEQLTDFIINYSDLQKRTTKI